MLPLRKRLKRIRRFLYPLALGPIKAWAKSFSDEECEVWARRLGRIAYHSLAQSRIRACANLHLAFGKSWSPEQIQTVAEKVFQNLIFNLLECLRFDSLDDQQFLGKIEVEGWEYVEAAHRAGKGGIVVSGHIGNWELAPAYGAKRGYVVNVVAKRIYLESLDQKLVEMREKMGVRTIYRDMSMRSMLRCLQRNDFLGIVPDQDVRRIAGIFVDFFGRPAHTPVGPALIALASGSPILMVRDIRMGSRHRITFDPPVYADRHAPREEEVRRLVTHYTERLEEFIREHPDQWVWFHRRWRTQPQQETQTQETFLMGNNVGPTG